MIVDLRGDMERLIKTKCGKESILDLLLKDHTTGRNILWATESYGALGMGWQATDEITPMRLVCDREKAENRRKKCLRRRHPRPSARVCTHHSVIFNGLWHGRNDA